MTQLTPVNPYESSNPPLTNCYIEETAPNEIILLVFQFLNNARDVANCGGVCTRWRKISENDPLWKVFYQREFGKAPDPKISAKTQFFALMHWRDPFKRGKYAFTPVALRHNLFDYKDSSPTTLIGENLFMIEPQKYKKDGIMLIDINSGTYQQIMGPIDIGLVGAVHKCGNSLVASDFQSTMIWDLQTNSMRCSHPTLYYPACGEQIWLVGQNEIQLFDILSQSIVNRILVTAIEVHTIDENYCLITTANYDLQLWSYGAEPFMIGSTNQLSRPLSRFQFITSNNNLVYFNVIQQNVYLFNFKNNEQFIFSGSTYSHPCDLLTNGPENTIFFSDDSGWTLLDERLEPKVAIKYADLPQDIGRAKSLIVLDNNNLLIMTSYNDLFIWNWRTNQWYRQAKVYDSIVGGKLLQGPNGTVFYTDNVNTFLIDTQCPTSVWLKQLGDLFAAQETCFSVLNELNDLAEQDKSNKTVIALLKRSYPSFFTVPGQGNEGENILLRKDALQRVANLAVPELKDKLDSLCKRLEKPGIKRIKDNLNDRFCLLPASVRKGIIEHFNKLIAHLNLNITGEEAFLKSPECIPYRSQAIFEYISTLPSQGNPAPQQPFFKKLPPKQLFYSCDLNAAAKKILNKQTVAAMEYMAFFQYTPDAFANYIGTTPGYFSAIFKTSQDLENIGINLTLFCSCQKILEGLFPRSDVSMATLQPHLTALIEYIETNEEMYLTPASTRQSLLNTLKTTRDLESPSTQDIENLFNAISQINSSERLKQAQNLKDYLSNLHKTVAPRLRENKVVSAMEYLTILNIRSPTILSEILSVRPEFLQKVGLSTSEDLKVIGLQFEPLNQIKQMMDNLTKYKGKENHEDWLKETSALPHKLDEIIKNAKGLINFVESHGASLQDCDPEKFQATIEVLKDYLKRFDEAKQNYVDLSSWTVFCKAALRELSELEILCQKDLLRSYCLQPGITATWKTLDPNLTLSTLESLPENVFNMGS